LRRAGNEHAFIFTEDLSKCIGRVERQDWEDAFPSPAAILPTLRTCWVSKGCPAMPKPFGADQRMKQRQLISVGKEKLEEESHLTQSNAGFSAAALLTHSEFPCIFVYFILCITTT
jgi:hypothetical protein